MSTKSKLLRNITISIIVVFLTSCVSFFTSPKVYANSVNIKVTPSQFRIEAKPPADVRAPFTIENQSDTSVSFVIGYKLFRSDRSEDGKVSFLQEGEQLPTQQDHHIFDKMQIVDQDNYSHNTIELGPKQKERLQLRIRLPKDEPNGDYYFTLLFISQADQQDQNTSKDNKKDITSSSTIQSGAGINVLLAVGDKTAPQGIIETFSTPWLRQAGPVPFALTIQNNGMHYIAPKGQIVIKNMFGQAVGKVTIPQTVILSGMSRKIVGSPDTKSTSDLQKAAVQGQIAWPETFLLGLYTATLTMNMSENGPFYSRTIHFVAFPTGFLLGLAVVILLSLFIYVRIQRKLRE